MSHERSEKWWALFWSFRDDGDSVRSAARWASKVERAMAQSERGEGVSLDAYLLMGTTADTRWHRFGRNTVPAPTPPVDPEEPSP